MAFASSLRIEAHPDADLAESGRRGAVGHLGDLARLALAAVHHGPGAPRLGTADEVARVPESRRDALVGRIAEHADPLPLLHRNPPLSHKTLIMKRKISREKKDRHRLI